MSQKRCFIIDKSFITCNNCQLNYKCQDTIDAGHKIPGFCQEWSIIINPEETNNELAASCRYWLPDAKLDRSKCHVDAPEHKRWYERVD